MVRPPISEEHGERENIREEKRSHFLESLPKVHIASNDARYTELENENSHDDSKYSIGELFEPVCFHR